MAQRDIIVIGASSGGVEVLMKLIGGLHGDLPAAIFVVLHVREDAPSQLPAILNRSGMLPAAHAVDGEPIRRGRIYVAPPALQTYLDRGRIAVRRGPKENLHRPAIDALFRTAAHHYGSRVIGIVLTGSLDDGTAGLLAIKQAGGVAVVQDPADASTPQMPASALDRVNVDHVVRGDELAALVTRLVAAPHAAFHAGQETTDRFQREIPLETVEEAPAGEAYRSEELGTTASVTCPDCQGTLWEIDDGRGLRFRCRVGHGYSEQTIVKAQEDSVERALWAALRALEERVALLNKMAGHARHRGHDSMAGLFEERAQRADVDVRAIHEVITSGRALEPVASPEE